MPCLRWLYRNRCSCVRTSRIQSLTCVIPQVKTTTQTKRSFQSSRQQKWQHTRKRLWLLSRIPSCSAIFACVSCPNEKNSTLAGLRMDQFFHVHDLKTIRKPTKAHGKPIFPIEKQRAQGIPLPPTESKRTQGQPIWQSGS